MDRTQGSVLSLSVGKAWGAPACTLPTTATTEKFVTTLRCLQEQVLDNPLRCLQEQYLDNPLRCLQEQYLGQDLGLVYTGQIGFKL